MSRIHNTVEAARSAPGGEAVFGLIPVVLNELLCACLLAPFASNNLRAKPAAWVYGTDASMSRAGIVRTPATEAVSRELGRLSEFAGWRSRLPFPLRAYLDDFVQRSRAACRARDEPADSSDSEVDLSSLEPGIAPALSEGVLWDCAEVFRGDGNWSECVIAGGLRVHDGFDTRFSTAHDFCSIELFRLLVSLVLRRVVRIWHFGLPCVSWGTLRCPRVRSKCRPFGFSPTEPFTAQHSLIAIRVAFLMWLAHFNGQWASDEQPGGSVLHYLDIFQRLLREEEWTISIGGATAPSGPLPKSRTSGFTTSPGFSLCREGADCDLRGRHFKVEGSFTPERLALFESMCVGGSAAVYRVPPLPGQSVASGPYPWGAMRLMAKGAVRAAAAAKRDPSGPAFRPRHVAPDWVCEFIESAHFHLVIAYDFARPAHINCLESRTGENPHQAGLPDLSDTRIPTLIDSRVTIGAGAKGRSSSSALNRIRQGSLGFTSWGAGCTSGASMPLRGFARLTTLRVTGRFGVHASTSLRGSPASRPSVSCVWTSPCSRIVSAARGTSGAACYSLRATARARAAETGVSRAMARRVDAAPLLRHLGVSAAPPPRPPATTSKAQPKGPVRFAGLHAPRRHASGAGPPAARPMQTTSRARVRGKLRIGGGRTRVGTFTAPRTPAPRTPAPRTPAPRTPVPRSFSRRSQSQSGAGTEHDPAA